jgi:hypothetical protein
MKGCNGPRRSITARGWPVQTGRFVAMVPLSTYIRPSGALGKARSNDTTRDRSAMETSQSGPAIEFTDSSVHHFANPRAERCDWPERLNQVLDGETMARARCEIRRWAGYGATPLRAMESLATSCGVGQIYYKDEAERFGLGSFKALGGA